ncbi:MAG TPA: hypothetical protein VG889_04480 [Rhizomicrobium sp.]|nr:hypothetical protein [Rhizomicrobium sp.]
MKLTTSMRAFGVLIAAGLLAATTAEASVSKAERQAAWRAAIAGTPLPGAGCFHASYPLTTWRKVACETAPARPYVPASGTGHGAQTTGDGHDYAGVTTALTSMAVGTFPKAKHLVSETDGGANVYSLQINSNFMSGNAACQTANDPSKCLDWEQFVYSSSSQQAFMQYWLIHYTGGTVHCPSGWFSFSDDCYRNSASVHVPKQVITELPNITLSGSAVHGGVDTLQMTTSTDSYSTTGPWNVVYLADSWHESEWNVIGDGGGSQAKFNAGTKLTVRLDLTDGTTKKPVCAADHGTTGETNNLNLGKCKAKGGASPHIQFVEKLPK